MYKKRFASFYQYRNFYVSLLMLSVLFAMMLALSGQALAATLDPPPPGGAITDPVVRAVDIAKPAVVRIITAISGHLTVNFSQDKTAIFPQGTGKAYSATLSGSGTFISSNGDILTADHVVSPPAEVFQQMAAQDVSNYINQHPDLGLGQVSPDQTLPALLSGQIKSYSSYDLKQSEAFYSTDYTGALAAAQISGIPAQYHAQIDQIKKESAVDQKDVAIVHVALKDTPSVQLGDSSSVQQQDQLTIIGFPGNGDISNHPTDLLTSSVNKISVSSIKTTQNGAPVIQVGGNVEHGDSGGPALDGNGRVVGIVSFGLASADSPGGTSFLQASNSARDLVQALNLDTTSGPFQKLWEQSFDDYSANTAGHWHKAAQGFQGLSTSYPDFKAVTKYLTYAQDQAQKEQLSVTPTSTKNNNQVPLQLSGSGLLVAVIGAVALLGLALFTTLAWPRRKKKQLIEPGSQNGVSLQQPAQHQPIWPAVSPQPSSTGMYGDGRTPFDAQVSQTLQKPLQSFQQQPSGILRPWPCGHMNRSNARFCTICGDPAPVQPPVGMPPRPVEQ